MTPQSLSKTADAWRFEVRFNTHVTPITNIGAIQHRYGGAQR